MNKEEITIYNKLRENLKNNKDYGDALYIPLYTIEELKIKFINKYSKIHIGLINIPCSGFGDIINCSLFYQYLKQ